MSKKKQSSGCPCGLSASFDECCGRYIDAGVLAPTAESLMRSRYAAYTMNNGEYLLASWHQSTRPAELDLSREERFVKWLSLDVLSTQAGGESDEAGVVEFVARYKVNGRAQRLHEISRFRKEEGRWFYVDGDAEEG
ncbi:YchJ family protein [Aquitalea denitrificans]|uniref:YchJ family protein n=1 Tax=Aquitalea denitrificans TaxID=519081 RepID=UPI00135A7B28|nr:YchJ family metal-binding protein [Aquitalea denitrificans]